MRHTPIFATYAHPVSSSSSSPICTTVYKALQFPSRNSAQYPPRYSHCLYQRFPFLPSVNTFLNSFVSVRSKFFRTASTLHISRKKPARKVPFLNTTILIESRCVSISRSIFGIRGDILVQPLSP